MVKKRNVEKDRFFFKKPGLWRPPERGLNSHFTSLNTEVE
jgi:hypothetical protein